MPEKAAIDIGSIICDAYADLVSGYAPILLAIASPLMGIVYHAKFPISSGKVEGVNNMIKTIRRKAYGYRDTEYFFLKIIFASFRGPFRYKSHTIL